MLESFCIDKIEFHNLNQECRLNQDSQKGANLNFSSWVRGCFAVLARLAKLVKRLTSDSGKIERKFGGES